MLIDLTKLLSREGSSLEVEAPIEMSHFKMSKGEQYKLLEKTPLYLTLIHDKDQVIKLSGHGKVTCMVPCARCLKRVSQAIDLDFEHRVNMLDLTADEDEAEMAGCITADKCLDADLLAHSEILVHWPNKVLCKEDCKGLCPTCGKDLNEGACSCDHEDLDPRMAAFKEIFNDQKS